MRNSVTGAQPAPILAEARARGIAALLGGSVHSQQREGGNTQPLAAPACDLRQGYPQAQLNKQKGQGDMLEGVSLLGPEQSKEGQEDTHAHTDTNSPRGPLGVPGRGCTLWVDTARSAPSLAQRRAASCTLERVPFFPGGASYVRMWGWRVKAGLGREGHLSTMACGHAHTGVQGK